jgi:acylphosphatase
VAELHVIVAGRVQGVGFRFFVRQHARTLDLRGWVKNQPDGSVEVAAEGSQESVDTLRDLLAEGPPGARVEEVRDVGGQRVASGDYPFTILR